MTIQEARELLGENIQGLSDKEVSDMILRDSMFMDSFVNMVLDHRLTIPNEKPIVNIGRTD